MTMALVVQWLAFALCSVAALYAICAAVAMPRFGSRSSLRALMSRARQAALQPVSVLKPLCGAEPRLYENLATFCAQAYPDFQLLFGVSSMADPAIEVVKRLQAAWPQRDIELVVDARMHGSNRKVSNLMNLDAHARHDLIVLADSDISVEPDYLRMVTAPLARPRTGVVTCLYRARSVGGFWPRLGALFINEWFAPSVRVAQTIGARKFGFGATLALRRETLERIGGFAALKDCLADDYMLAHYVRAQGLDTVLVPVLVDTDVTEATLRALWLRETRWLRTIRSVNTVGFASLCITFSSPWLALGAALAWWPRLGLAGATAGAVMGVITLAGIVARGVLHARGSLGWRAFWRGLPLVPIRDGLLLLQWCAAAFGSHVVWRDVRMAVSSADAEAPGPDVLASSRHLMDRDR